MPIPRLIYDRVREEVERELAVLVPRLVEELHPQRVLLFGSAARGEAGEDSDIDLCVIAETNLPFFERVALVRRLHHGRKSLEPLVYTPAEWRQMLQEERDFICTIAAEGRLLYEA
jgi:uncharacterized protein